MAESLFAGSALLVVIAIVGVFIFLPVVAAFIILLVQCIRNKWTRKLLIPFIIIGAVMVTTLLSTVFGIIINSGIIG